MLVSTTDGNDRTRHCGAARLVGDATRSTDRMVDAGGRAAGGAAGPGGGMGRDRALEPGRLTNVGLAVRSIAARTAADAHGPRVAGGLADVTRRLANRAAGDDRIGL